MGRLIKLCEYTAEEVAEAFWDLYGTEMVTDDGWQEYSAFELLASLEDWSRKEVLEQLARRDNT